MIVVGKTLKIKIKKCLCALSRAMSGALSFLRFHAKPSIPRSFKSDVSLLGSCSSGTLCLVGDEAMVSLSLSASIENLILFRGLLVGRLCLRIITLLMLSS